MLTSSALFVTLPHAARSFTDLLIVALALRFLVGVLAALAHVRVRWLAIGPKVETVVNDDREALDALTAFVFGFRALR